MSLFSNFFDFGNSQPDSREDKSKEESVKEQRGYNYDNIESTPYTNSFALPKMNIQQYREDNRGAQSSRFEPSRFAGFEGMNNRESMKDSMKESMSERKGVLIVPRLEIEGSKGSQVAARSQNSLSNGSNINMNTMMINNNISSINSDNTNLGRKNQPGNPFLINSTKEVMGKENQTLQLIKYIKQNEDKKCVRIINNELADLNARGENQWTPLHFACWVGNMKIINLLLLGRADMNAKARNDLTPLMIACSVGNHHIFTVLMTAGANWLDLDGNGSSCLHYAAQSCSKEIVEDLLRLGSDPSLRNRQGKLAEDNTSSVVIQQIIKDKRESNSNIFVPIFSYTYDKIKNIFNSDDSSKTKNPQKVWPNDFDILSLLGKGSFGQVYLVRKKETGVKYAMKVLNKHKVMSRNG